MTGWVGCQTASTQRSEPTLRVCAAGLSVEAGQRDLPCPAPFAKYSCSRAPRLESISRAVQSHSGAVAIVIDAGLDAVDVAASGVKCDGVAGFGLNQTREQSNSAQTNDAEAYGEGVWFWHPLLVSNRRRSIGPTGRGYSVNSPMMVTRRIRRRGERVISRKAIAQGMSEVLR
jgi:hypothetical protein